MITPKLEELIWNKEAAYKTWTIITGGASLPVKPNKTIIILGFDFFPFIDALAADYSAATLLAWTQRINHQIIISSLNKRHTFLHRSGYSSGWGIINTTPNFFKCYLPFTSDINLNIVALTPPDKWSIISGDAPDKSNQKPIPLGLGTQASNSTPTPLYIQFGDLLNTESRPYPDARGINDLSFSKAEISVAADTKLNVPIAVPSGVNTIQFPMVTVHYVEINKRLTDTFI